MRESFVFYASFYKAIEELDEKKQLKLYKSIIKLALENEENENLSGIEKAIFELIKPQILANNKRYEDGKKGGRPNNKKSTGFENEKTTGFENEKPNVNVNVNVNDNENVNVNSNVNGEQEKKDEIFSQNLFDPFQGKYILEFANCYKRIFNKPFVPLTDDRVKLAELLKLVFKDTGEPNFLNEIERILNVLNSLEFDAKKPLLPWLLTENNFLKVYSGEFDKHLNSQQEEHNPFLWGKKW